MYNKKLFTEISAKLGVSERDLSGLIEFESGWDPKAKNPHSSARGLLQFIDSTSRGLGYLSSKDLVKKLPTVDLQLRYAVLPYLLPYSPFYTIQSLHMAVFYPKARFWPETRAFPSYVQKVNPGIRTPLDYMQMVYRKLSLRYVPRLLYLAAGAFLLYKKFKEE